MITPLFHNAEALNESAVEQVFQELTCIKWNDTRRPLLSALSFHVLSVTTFTSHSALLDGQYVPLWLSDVRIALSFYLVTNVIADLII